MGPDSQNLEVTAVTPCKWYNYLRCGRECVGSHVCDVCLGPTHKAPECPYVAGLLAKKQ